MSHRHDPSHDHAAPGHSGGHSHGPAYAVGPFGWSIAQRLGVVAGTLVFLWLLVLWALGE